MASAVYRPAIGAMGLALCGLLATGCGEAPNPNDGPPKGPVRGRATLGDKPLGNVMLTFTNPTNGFAVNVQTDENGEYEVQSYKDTGLPAGTYQVTVSAVGTTSDEEIVARMVDEDRPLKVRGPSAGVAMALPAAYANRETSGLAIEVASGENPPFNFELKSKK
jgi:hypothetical protein